MTNEPVGSDLWTRVEHSLRHGPTVPTDAVDRVMARVRSTPMEVADRGAGRDVLRWLTQRRAVSVSPLQLLAAGLVLVMGLGAFVEWRERQARSSQAALVAERAPGQESSVAPAAMPAAMPGSVAGGVARPVQFVFHAERASSVTVAGDFNDWDPTSTPLRRIGADGVWSVVVPLTPGRHLYSFVVDGRRWVPDAEAPRAPETEFGTERSIVLVESGS